VARSFEVPHLSRRACLRTAVGLASSKPAGHEFGSCNHIHRVFAQQVPRGMVCGDYSRSENLRESRECLNWDIHIG